MNAWHAVSRYWRAWCEEDGVDEFPWPAAHRQGTGLRGKVRSPIDGVGTELLVLAINVAHHGFPVCPMDRLIGAVVDAPATDFDVARSRHWRPFVTEGMIGLANDVWRPYLVTARENMAEGFVWPNTTSHHRDVLEQVWPRELTRLGWIRAWPLGVERAVYVKSPVEGIEVEEIVEAARAAANRRFPFRAALTEVLEAIDAADDRQAVDRLLETCRVLVALRT